MAKSEWKDDGRRCQQCGGTSRPETLLRYAVTADGAVQMVLDMHPTCVGTFLSHKLTASARFAPGVD